VKVFQLQLYCAIQPAACKKSVAISLLIGHHKTTTTTTTTTTTATTECHYCSICSREREREITVHFNNVLTTGNACWFQAFSRYS